MGCTTRWRQRTGDHGLFILPQLDVEDNVPMLSTAAIDSESGLNKIVDRSSDSVSGDVSQS